MAQAERIQIPDQVLILEFCQMVDSAPPEISGDFTNFVPKPGLAQCLSTSLQIMDLVCEFAHCCFTS